VHGAAEQTITQLRADIYRHVLRLPLERLEVDRLGATIPRIMTDPDGVSSLVGSGVLQLVGGSLTVLAGSAILIYLDWRLTIGTLLLLAAFGVAAAFIVVRLRRVHSDIAATFADVSGRAAETLARIHIVRAAGTEPREERLFRDGVTELQRHSTRSLLDTSLLGAIAAVTAGGISVVLMVVGGSAVLRGEMTPGELLWFAMTMGIVARPLTALAAASSRITHALAGLDRIAAIMAIPIAGAQRPSPRRLPAMHGDVVFENVSCAWGDRLVLRDVSFRAAPGSLTVVLGANGAGKTTLLHLMLALRAPTAGCIRIDGNDLRDIELTDYRRQLGFMLHDSLLLHGTIRDNIAYGMDDVSDTQIRRAAEAAGAHEFIARLPAGYDTRIGEHGAGLSAGQRQRLALARALAPGPRILLLDEPTANIDRATASAVLRDVLQSRQGRTTFLVTHRQDAARDADQVLVIDDGNVQVYSPIGFMEQFTARVPIAAGEANRIP
jgi:ABC-type multidrug transport system fused ATPase/permease subunit